MRRLVFLLIPAFMYAAEPVDNQNDAAIFLGKEASKALKMTLKSHLTKEMKANGPEKTIEFCSNNATLLTHEVSTKSPKGVMVKRVTEKPRNPQNAPDTLDEVAFEYFAKKFEKEGKYPEYFVAQQRSKQDKQMRIYRYYEPLLMDQACLVCHGDTIKPAVHAKIRSTYPNDKAFGYKEGELRGLIAVQILPQALAKKEN